MSSSQKYTLNHLDWLEEMKKDLHHSSKAKEAIYNFDFNEDLIKPGNFDWTILTDAIIGPKN